MKTAHPDIFGRLAAPFDGGDVKTRSQSGRSFRYITARTAMNRLDDVLGPENWWDSYQPHENSVLCKLTIRLPDTGETITKMDAGGYAGMSDQGDDDKSGYSDAFKRAAVKFGVARYLYNDGVPDYEGVEASGAAAKLAAPTNVRPEPERPAATARPPVQGQQQPRSFRLPPPGKAVYGWAKSMEEHFQVSLIPSMRDIGTDLGVGTNFVEWDADAAFAVTSRAALFLGGLENYKGEFNGILDLEDLAAKVDRDSAVRRDSKRLQEEAAEALEAALGARLGREPTNAERRSCLDRVSAKAVNSSGQRGEVLQGSLYDCLDLEWLKSIAAVARGEAAAHGVPGVRAGMAQPEEEDEDDIF